MSKKEILEQFKIFAHGSEGIGAWLTEATSDVVFDRLASIEADPLSKVQLNQLLVLGNEAPCSDDFFSYYWLEEPTNHPYPVGNLSGFDRTWINAQAITSLTHLKWGLLRLYTDGLLFFGNIRSAYRNLRSLDHPAILQFFQSRRFDIAMIKKRGPALPLKSIPKDDRYLISEMACKSYGDGYDSPGDLKRALTLAFQTHKAMTGGRISVGELIEGGIAKTNPNRTSEYLFSVDDLLKEQVESQEELDQKFEAIAAKFHRARESALANTKYYLSMVSDLDVYVATSMRSRQDFRNMATFCEQVFGNERLRNLQLRYFDPTLSAAAGHEDKGLIECLMVKCAKVLVYCAGEKESYGKDAEAAMALSLGKPVIFYCDQEQRSRFYKEVHPLSRLIEFNTGIAVGAMVTDKLADVPTLLERIFENKMEFTLEQNKPGYLRLKENLTGSVVRLQTSDRMLDEAFWNHYHNRRFD